MDARRISLAGALAAASLFSAHCAMAAGQPEPPALPATVYQQSNAGSCSASKCTVTFRKVPAGKTLQTTNLSCFVIATGASGIPAYASLQVGNAIVSFMPLDPSTTDGTDGFASGALAGNAFIEAGKAPSVVITGAVQSATCTLSGRLE